MADLLTDKQGLKGEHAPNKRASADHLRTSRQKYDSLYFMGTACGFVKIGRTCDLDKRLTKIQTTCPLEIEWAIAWRGRGHEEKAWHEAFADAHVRGEWFRLTDELRDAIRRQRIEAPTPAGDVDAAYERLFAPKLNRRPSY